MQLLTFPEYRAVHGRQAGTYLSAYASHGGDFHEIRSYEPGDNIARIDWTKTLSRSGDPLVRSYRDEVDRSIHIYVDVTPTLRFSAEDSSKLDCLISAVYLLVKSSWFRQMGGSVSFMSGDRMRKVPLPSNEVTLSRMLADVRQTILDSRHADLATIERAIAQADMRDAMLFVFTDRASELSKQSLGRLGQRNLVYAVQIRHPLEDQILRDFEFSASDGMRNYDAHISVRDTAKVGEFDPIHLVQSVLLDASKDVYLPFAHAFAHPVWKA